ASPPKAVFLTACETSTGALSDVAGICQIAREHGALTVVDGMTWIGSHDVQPDQIAIDVLLTSSQKALGSRPGLSFVTLSEAAHQCLEERGTRAGYLDLLTERDEQRNGNPAFTPAVTLVTALDRALNAM